jgi:hypothetical protein
LCRQPVPAAVQRELAGGSVLGLGGGRSPCHPSQAMRGAGGKVCSEITTPATWATFSLSMFGQT